MYVVGPNFDHLIRLSLPLSIVASLKQIYLNRKFILIFFSLFYAYILPGGKGR